MDGRLSDIDVTVIGAGPSGCAAAIWCAKHGLNVCLIESLVFPRHKPGETLHPGLSVLFQQLDVEDDVISFSKIRPSGYFLKKGETMDFTEFGKDSNGSWNGFQIFRSDLDFLLLKKAIELKVNLLQPCKALSIILEKNRVIGLNTSKGKIFSRFTIDATGNCHWIGKQLGLEMKFYSKPLIAKYGYANGKLKDEKYFNPVFEIVDNGWLWIAKITDDIYHWTRLFTEQGSITDFIPADLSELKLIDKIRGSDVTWRNIYHCSGLGYFITGDSCVVFDPAISKGVLRGIYSGIMASETINNIIKKKLTEPIGINIYKKWMASWFSEDLKSITELYKINNLDVWSGLI